MKSNNIYLGQKFGSLDEHSGPDSKSAYADAVNDPTGWINDQVSAPPACGQTVPAPTQIDLTKEGLLDSLVKDAFERDESCQVVFTGNAGNNENADVTYAKATAYAMAQDMCSQRILIEWNYLELI